MSRVDKFLEVETDYIHIMWHIYIIIYIYIIYIYKFNINIYNSDLYIKFFYKNSNIEEVEQRIIAALYVAFCLERYTHVG